MKNNHKTVPQNMDTGCTQLLFSDCKILSILAWNVSAVVSKAADKKKSFTKTMKGYTLVFLFTP